MICGFGDDYPGFKRIKCFQELLTVISKQVSDLLNLQGEVKKLDPKVTMKWGSRKKKDKVDLILVSILYMCTQYFRSCIKSMIHADTRTPRRGTRMDKL